MVTVKISSPSAKNVAKLFANLSNEVPNIPAKIFEQIINKTVDNMKENAPVRTGFMRDNISGTTTGTNDAIIISAAPYSGFVNFGTSRQAAQPFFSDGIDFAKREMQEAGKNELHNTIRKSRTKG